MRRPLLMLVPLLLLAAACGRSKMAQYYVLTPSASPEKSGGEQHAIGIGPVNLPRYVDRENIVTTVTAQEVRLDTRHLWAEPLDENFLRVLTENLSVTLGTEDVFLYPWPVGAVDYHIDVNVVRFSGALEGDAFLEARWSVHDTKNKTVIVTRRSNLSRKAGKDYNSFAAAMSEMVAELSMEIAHEIPK